ncbi:MAG TPA: hypothetical protein PKH37_06245, partial [Alphaproteobacteria bacterium]|nr:hypothetical protein [Alphaproteobacteria bacterium]
DGAEASYDAIHTYLTVAKEHKVEYVRAVGTAALRDATDGPDFVRKVDQKMGLKIEVLTGEEEARYAAAGVLALDPEANGVVADFGGGSLELALVGNGRIIETVSLPLGAFRIKSMGENAEEQIEKSLSFYHDKFGNQNAVYAIGGSWRALAKAHMIRHGLKQDAQGYAIPGSSLVAFCKVVEVSPIETLEEKYQLEGHRASLAPVAAKMLRLLVETLNPAIFVTSEAGVRDGLVYEFLSSSSKEA